MSIAGGLVASESLPKTNLSEAYVPAGEGKWVVLSGNTKVAVEHKKGETVPEGFAVINIEYGNDMTEMGPVPVTHGTWTIMVPRGSNRILPLSHVNVLNDAITTEYFQQDMSSQLTSRSGRRFNFRVIHWPKTGEKRATEFEEGARDLSVDELENSRERHEVIELDQD